MAQQNFNTREYMGKWIEVSSIPQEWSEPCNGATANYRMIGDGKIEVTNRCLDENGEIVGMYTGQARVKDQQKRNGHFLVSFGNVNGDYIVYDTDYVSYALVGGKKPNMLWILRRPNTKINEVRYNSLVRRARREGYDIDTLHMAS